MKTYVINVIRRKINKTSSYLTLDVSYDYILVCPSDDYHRNFTIEIGH